MSSGMLEKARSHGCYDVLERSDILEYLAAYFLLLFWNETIISHQFEIVKIS